MESSQGAASEYFAPQATSSAPMSRLKMLDLLRALAVFLVLGRHMIPFPDNYPDPIRSISEHWILGGWIGVDLFFVLSGFLVSGLLFKEYIIFRHINFKNFFIRRGFKIYPSFYSFIISTIIITQLVHFGPDYKGVWSEVFFYQSYQPGLWTHTWSLAVEEHFYLLLPLLLTILYKVRPSSNNPFNIMPKIFFMLAVIILCLRFITAFTDEFGEWRNLYPTHLRLDSLFFGALLSYYFHFEKDRFVLFFRSHRRHLALIAITLIAPAFFWELVQYPFMYTIGFSLLYIASGIIVGLVVTIDYGNNNILDPVLKPIYFIGSRSYSIYLWHWPFQLWGLWLIQKLFTTKFDPLTLFAVYFLGSLALGILMAAIIELPALRWRDQFFPSTATNRTNDGKNTASMPQVS